MSANSLDVQFTDLSTPFGLIAAWLWDFGDGSPESSLENPEHTFPIFDIYAVTLAVFGAYGGYGVAQHVVDLFWSYCQAFDIDDGGYTAGNVATPPNPTLTKAVYVPAAGWNTHVSVLVDTTTQIYLNFTPCVIRRIALQMHSNSGSGTGIVHNNFQAVFYYPAFDPDNPADNIVANVAQNVLDTTPGTYSFVQPVDDTILIGGVQIFCGEGVQGDSTFLIQIVEMEGYGTRIIGNFC